MSHVYYDKGCSINDNFERGVDTQLLVKLLISFIYYYLPRIKYIKLHDKSTRECDDGSHVNLYELSYIISGKTWYEKHFHAYLEGQNLIDFNKQTELFQEKKKSLQWDHFKNLITTEFPIEEYILKDLYDKAKTWQQFFGPVSEMISIASFCIFVSKWLEIFVKSYMGSIFLKLEYTIPADKNIISFSILQHMTGGKAPIKVGDIKLTTIR